MQNENFPAKSRIYYLDYLRTFFVFLIVCHHAILPLDQNGSLEIVRDDELILIDFLLRLILNDHRIMFSMFFLAGFFTYPSIRKSFRKFIKKKIFRLFIPMVFGTYILFPLAMFLRLKLGGSEPVFITHMINYMADIFPSVSIGHLWFLKSLLIFYAVCVVVYALLGKMIERFNLFCRNRELKYRFLIPFILIFPILISLYRFNSFPDYQGFSYRMYFSMGVVISLCNIEDQITDILKKYPLVIIILTFILIDLSSVFNEVIYTVHGKWIFFLLDFFRVMRIFMFLMILLMIFKKYLDRPVQWMMNLSRKSYSIYYFHYPISLVFTYLIVDMNINMYIKILLVIIINITVTYLFSTAFLYFKGKIKQIVSDPVHHRFHTNSPF
jgi:peptidoglycan/LPS O-acetylase OafA/YrhL